MRLTRVAAVAALVAAVAVAAVATAAARPTSHPKLFGTVGKNGAFKIKLVNASGTLVKTLKAGTYTVVIHDYSHIHNYELDGPAGKSWKFTTPNFAGTKTFTIRFAPGKYKAYCAPHESMMFQHFTVTK